MKKRINKFSTPGTFHDLVSKIINESQDDMTEGLELDDEITMQLHIVEQQVYIEIFPANDDVVLMTDEPQKIAAAVRLSRRTLAVVKQNIVFALAVKAGVMALGVLGLANMWGAVFADVGVSLLAVANSLRPLYFKE